MPFDEQGEATVMQAEIDMNAGLELADIFVSKKYLSYLDELVPIPLKEDRKSFTCMSLFEITKIVFDLDENINDKLVSVYSALSSFGSSAILVLTGKKSGVQFFLGTRDEKNPGVAREILRKSLQGNFPGIEIVERRSRQIETLFRQLIPEEFDSRAVTSVSIVPSPRDDDKEHFVQGLEKFIDSMSGEEYTAVIISTPYGKAQVEAKKRGDEKLYSTLSQFSSINLTVNRNESTASAKTVSESFSEAVNEGITDTNSTNQSTTEGATSGTNRGTAWGFGVGSTNNTASDTQSASRTTGDGFSHATSKTTTKTKGNTTGDSTTTTHAAGTTVGTTRDNKAVQDVLDKIDAELERIRSCESYGLWDSACYFIARTPETALVAANTFKALVSGTKTSEEHSAVNFWDNSYSHMGRNLTIMEYLRYGIHPCFRYDPDNKEGGYDEQIVTPASLISGLELPVLMGFPHKSVSGVTAIISAEFGRNVFDKSGPKTGRYVDIGAIRHMGETFENNRVHLDLQSLASHCFITGSTGVGKTNTTSKIIEELAAKDVSFLVIEPAKGEYKLSLGNMPGINIFTTNPRFYNMLGIDPFEFDPEIHVLEHLDRLIEIFSACWPLYAAMPALLKASFEQAYIRHGWDLNHSLHIDKGNGKYPSFRDVVEILPELLAKSQFSAETRGDYVGSLVTRVESLTNGLAGQIFTRDAVPDSVLFDENTIVDLSRIGSAETKSLLMGILVLKLTEYRQASASGTNSPLRHVTILEEAHNLLKRTSTQQGQESANVQGKSVEMISNSIAEMRTYGEGFIIVDQSPTAVDVSAIKNTNTKIIMRLPEADDCEAVGRAIGLNEAQIKELSRLDMGVAAIYQNDWLEAVLTKIDECSRQYKISAAPENQPEVQRELLGRLLQELLNSPGNRPNMRNVRAILRSSSAPGYFKTRCLSRITEYSGKRNGADGREAFHKLCVDLLNCGDLLRIYEEMLPPRVNSKEKLTGEIRTAYNRWCALVRAALSNYAQFPDRQTWDRAFGSVLRYAADKHPDRENSVYALLLYCWRQENHGGETASTPI